MKTCIIKNPCFLFCLIACLGLMLPGQVTAQTFTSLHSFSGGADGCFTGAGLISSGNTLYGTCRYGGTYGAGTVFAINTNGSGFTVLHSFLFSANSEGAVPDAGLTSSGNTLYGTTWGGGNSCSGCSYSPYSGTVFAVNTDGTGFTTVYFFTEFPDSRINSDGAGPVAGLALSGNTLYGTAASGGSGGSGTVFSVNTDGTGFTTIYTFTPTDANHVNSDGAYPLAGLFLSGNTLYGTTVNGGNSGNGTVFSVNVDGTAFTSLHSFTAVVPYFTNQDGNVSSTNTDGAWPQSGLILSGNSLYGTCYLGGSGGSGTVFAVNTDGTGFRILHSFTANSTNSSSVYINSDGAYPLAGLFLSSNTLYGAAPQGGNSGNGTVFAVNTDGTGFSILHSFTATSSGAGPNGLILSGNILYGTTSRGGSGGSGTLFSISLPVSPPQLTIIPWGANVILTWPTNFSGFTLQSTTNIASPIWITSLPAPVVVNGQNTVTNPISGTQQFFRLAQ